MTASERLEREGYEEVLIFDNFGYDDALIGVTTDNRAVYDFDKMADWLVEHEGMTYEDAVDWISYNTIRSLGYAGADAPLIMFSLEDA